MTNLGLFIYLFFQIFSQKLLFKFSKENFELDPPLPTKTNVVRKISLIVTFTTFTKFIYIAIIININP